MEKAGTGTGFVVIGGANADIYGRVAASETSPGDSNPGTIAMHPGGVGRNIAENLGHLGASVEFIGGIGRGGSSEMIMASLAGAGVSTRFVQRNPDTDSDFYLAIHDADGGLVAAVNSMALAEALDADRFGDPGLGSAISHAAMVVLDANLSPSALKAVFARHGAECRIAVDAVSSAKSARLAPHLAEIDYLKCNRIEASRLTGADEGSDTVEMAAAMSQAGVGVAIVTDGNSGFSVADGDSRLDFPASAGGGGNTSGAGDALFACFLYALAKGAPIGEAAAIARSAAALTMGVEGPVNPAVASLMEGKEWQR